MIKVSHGLVVFKSHITSFAMLIFHWLICTVTCLSNVQHGFILISAQLHGLITAD